MKIFSEYRAFCNVRVVTLLVSMILFLSAKSYATHIYGADLFYTHVSGNVYSVSMYIYGDCAGSSFPSLPGTPQVRVYNGSTLYTTLNLVAQSPTSGLEVTPVCPSQKNNTKCSSLTNPLPGVKRFFYKANVTLNTTSANWRFRFTGGMGSTSSAGRSTSITNITSSGSSVMNLEATLNNTSVNNTSPTYTTIPTPFFCINKPANYNHGSVDADGDSLVYSLVPGLEATGTVTYSTGYSATAPLAAATGTFNFSSSTGQLAFTPNQVQQSLVVAQVSEYRNGVLIGTSMREMTFVVLNNCSNNPPSGNITNNSSGTVDTSKVKIKACKSAGLLTFNINPTDLDTDKINMSYTGLPSGASLNITNNGTTAPTSVFSWNLTSIPPGAYTFFITYVDEGCPLSSKQTIAYTVTVLPVPSVEFKITTPATCTKKAEVSMTPSVSPSPWQLQVLQGSSVLHTFTGVTSAQTDTLAPGTYTIRVTNADTCFKDTSVTVPPPPDINLSLNITHPLCNNDSNGKVVVSASGGKPTFTYAIGTGSFGSVNTFSNLPGGYQTFKVKDQNECVKDTLVQLINPPPIHANVNFVQPPCNYFNSGVITVNAINGKPPYLYALDAGSFSSTNTYSGLYSGSYTLHIKDSNSCTMDTLVVLPDSIKVHANTTITNILCNSDSTGVITLSGYGATAPYKYRLNPGSFGSSGTFNSLPAATHSFRIEDTNKCYLDTSITLTEPARLNAATNLTNVLCHGDSTGVINAGASGGVSPYRYALGGGSYTSTSTFNNLPAGTYTIHIKDTNDCIRDTSITLTQPTEIKFGNLPITDPTCYSASNGQVVINSSGGVNPHTYAIGTSTFSSVSTFGGLTAGTYIFYVKDSNSCVKDTSLTLTQPPRVVPSAAIKNSTCSPLDDGQVTLGATGGVPGYRYAVGPGSYSTNPVFTSLAAGTYTFHVRDVNNCIIDTIITVNDSIIVNGSFNIVDALCKDSSSGSISVSGTDGVSPYTYAINSGTYSGSPVFSGLKAATYIIHIKDKIGCKLDTSLVVDEPTQLRIAAMTITEPSCHGYVDGKATITPQGGTPIYQYAYNTSPYNTGSGFGNLGAGTYTFRVKDLNNCYTDTIVTIGEPTELKYTLQVTDILCNGDSTGKVQVNGSGGTPPYTYAYDTKTFQNSSLLTGMKAGLRVIKMKDSMGCIKDSNVFIKEPAKLLLVNPSITNPTCEGYPDGAVKIYGNGGVSPYNYTVDNGTFGNNNFFQQLKEGAHTFSVKDANNCVYDTSITLIGYPHILFDNIESLPVSCFGSSDGQLIVYASGGIQPLTYKIGNEAAGTDNKFNNLLSGKHTITIIDSAGCMKDSTVYVETPDKLATEMIVTPNKCEGIDDDGAIEAKVTGGTKPYKYEWSTMPATFGDRISGMPNGTYTVFVTDYNECADTAEATIIYNNCCIVFVPDAFTPNNDGKNDVIHVRVKGDFVLKRFSIYNRFGERVFQTANIADGWDGIHAGNMQDLGTYNYYIEGICGNEGKKEVSYKGTIILVR